MASLRASVPTSTTLRSMTSVPAQASMILVRAHPPFRSIEAANIPLIFNHGTSLTISRLRRINNLHYRFFSSTSLRHTGGSRRYRDFGSGYNTSYDPYVDTRRGPLHQNKAPGRPPMYPRDLKRIVDDYVVGQERAKKTICSTIFNHYQNVRRRNELELQERSARERQQRQQLAREREARDVRHPDSVGANNDTDRAFDPVQGKYADDFTPLLDHQPPTPTLHEHHGAGKSTVSLESALNQPLVLADETPLASHVNIDKSNLLLIGPTGVGKTYILETLSKKLKIPFAISDCNSFTQAGYIGQDVEACIERLLIEANYDVQAAENGIVVLDEFDKIARRESNNGRDVGGEGVQQALLKLVEGTKVTVNVKDNRSSRTVAPIPTNYGAPPQPPSSPQGGPPTGKSEQYTIDTRNILFVFCGAFVGLDKVIMRRVSRPALGFGADVKPKLASNGTGSGALPPELFAHLPHHPQSEGIIGASDFQFSPLDLATPTDLQAFGFIPELIGRLHNICALSNLSVKDLYRVLTEPRNCLVSQYTALFETYPSRLGFTDKALHAIAERAAKSETGARGLKMEMERVLAEPMFLAPQSYVLITEACVNGTTKAECWGKDGRLEFGARLREEDGLSNSFNEMSSFDEPKAAGQCGA